MYKVNLWIYRLDNFDFPSTAAKPSFAPCALPLGNDITKQFTALQLIPRVETREPEDDK